MAFFSFQTQSQEDVPRPIQEALDLQSFSHPPSPALEEASQAVWKLQNQVGQEIGQGTGFFIAPKLLITDFHVLQGLLDKVELTDIRLIHSTIPGVLKINRIKALFVELDLALLEIDSPSNTYLRIQTEPISEMEDLFLLGYNTGSFHYITKTGHLKQNDFHNYFLVNHANLAGASGGPILSSEGQVTGVASFAFENLLFSLKSDLLKSLIDGDTGTHCGSQNPKQCIQSAMDVIHKQAEQSNVLAQFQLAMMYLYGIGVEHNDNKAFQLFEKAAIQDFLPAINGLAMVYKYGEGVEHNDAKAFQLFEKAAIQGLLPSINHLAIVYKYGEGVEQNDTKAFQLFEKAAIQGYAESQFQLAIMYLNSEGVEQNDVKAFQFFEKAAYQVHIESQYNAAMMYLYGRGVEQNHDKAIHWLNLSAEQNFPPAIETLFLMYRNGMITNDDKADSASKKSYIDSK